MGLHSLSELKVDKKFSAPHRPPELQQCRIQDLLYVGYSVCCNANLLGHSQNTLGRSTDLSLTRSEYKLQINGPTRAVTTGD
jgi:hypothetical protein